MYRVSIIMRDGRILHDQECAIHSDDERLGFARLMGHFARQLQK